MRFEMRESPPRRVETTTVDSPARGDRFGSTVDSPVVDRGFTGSEV